MGEHRERKPTRFSFAPPLAMLLRCSLRRMDDAASASISAIGGIVAGRNSISRFPFVSSKKNLYQNSFLFVRFSLFLFLLRSALNSRTAHMLPYIGLRGSLSLAWLSHPLLAILLLGVSLSILFKSIDYLVIDAKESITATCQGVQVSANVLASLPYYSAQGINEFNHKATLDVIKGAAEVLDIALLSIEAIAM